AGGRGGSAGGRATRAPGGRAATRGGRKVPARRRQGATGTGPWPRRWNGWAGQRRRSRASGRNGSGGKARPRDHADAGRTVAPPVYGDQDGGRAMALQRRTDMRSVLWLLAGLSVSVPSAVAEPIVVQQTAPRPSTVRQI